ncbi:MAG: tandem-95 repeat protein, partial [Caldilineaceae bacterium]|nr:tandem-95 repeat protein [Caldilineaceae bacterium]
LSLTLSQNNNALNGYVSLDKTLVYSVEHTLGSGASAVKIGPYLSGVVNGANINVQSEKINLAVDGRALQRQFRLLTTNVTNNGAELNGEYRETLWGYTSAPVTVVGTFTLHRTGSNAIAPVLEPTAPIVVADTATTTQGKAVTINVLGNDSAANGGTLTITAVGKPQFGTTTTDGKSVTYTPNANFTGTDTFSYMVSDGTGGTSTSSVTVTVNGQSGPNQPPTTVNDSVTITPGTAILIDVLENDSDPNGDTLSISIDGPPQHGTAVVQDGKVLYTPTAGFSGTDSFTYIVSDGRGGTATGSVTVVVTGAGQAGENAVYLPLIQR